MLHSVWIPGQATVRTTNSTAAPSPGLLEGQQALVVGRESASLKIRKQHPF